MHGPGTVSWGPAGRLLGRMCSGMSGAIELGGADHLESRGRLGHMDLLTGVHSADCFFLGRMLRCSRFCGKSASTDKRKALKQGSKACGDKEVEGYRGKKNIVMERRRC